MPQITNQPANHNMLAPQTHKLVIKRLPNIVFFCTEVNVPSVNLPQADMPNQFVKYPVPGDHLQFGELQVQFIVDEDMKNYEELFTWMQALGFPHQFQQFKDISPTGRVHGLPGADSVLSDITLYINSSKHNPNRQMVFEDAWPSAITDLRFTTTDNDVEYIVCSGTFIYTKFTIIPQTS